MNEKREYYEKAYRWVRLARYAVLIVLVLFLIISMTVFREDITFDNFRYLMKYLEISPPAVTEGEKNITFSVSSDTSFGMIGDKLMAADTDTVLSYDMGGRKILQETFSYQNPVSVKNDKYMLIYDLDGYKLSVYNSFSKVCEKTLSTPIEYACLSADGGFAVITREKSYSGGFEVYDRHYKKIYSFMTRSATVTDLCYDGKAGKVACATTDAKNGDFYSQIVTFDVSQEEPIQDTAYLTGEMPLSLFCAGDGFALMTDAGLHYYGYDGVQRRFTDFQYDTPCSLYPLDGFFAVTLKSALAGTDSSVYFYDYEGNLLYSQYCKSQVAHIHAAYGRIYVLEPYTLHILKYDEAYTVTAAGTAPVEGEYTGVFALEENEVLLVSTGGAVKKSDMVRSDGGDVSLPEASEAAETEPSGGADTLPGLSGEIPPAEPSAAPEG